MYCCHVLKLFRSPSGHKLQVFKIVLICAFADLPLLMGM